MKFDWSVRTIREWREWLKKASNASWMQNWSYAQATHTYDKLRTRLALLLDEQNQPIGMLAVQELRLGPIQIINIKRGPIWFNSHDEKREVEFSKELRKEFPKSLLQRLRWIPSRTLSEHSVEEIEKNGFNKHQEFFQTDLVDLKISTEILRKNLDQKWRNCLNKAEKSNLTIKIDECGDSILAFVKGYEQHKKTKKFQGATPRFILAELKHATQQSDCYIILCERNREVIAGGAFVVSGKSASYRAGWSTKKGRLVNAGYLVLWQALLEAKKRKLDCFDVGGILSDQAPGVTKFKSGLGGERIHLTTFY